MKPMIEPEDIVDFWYADSTRDLWFESTPEFDRELRDRYQPTWEQARRGELGHWRDSATGCLALVILLDQFPLNMFRGQALAFATEADSREVARHALEQGFDREFDAAKKAFLYMPFMHSEELADQDLSLRLYDQPGLESNLRFARHHRDIVARFGRFPHRNAALGRDSSEAEIEYLQSKEAFTG